MEAKKAKWGFLTLCACIGWLVLGAGCATTDTDRDSDLPWNTPQPWEASPSIPGFGDR